MNQIQLVITFKIIHPDDPLTYKFKLINRSYDVLTTYLLGRIHPFTVFKRCEFRKLIFGSCQLSSAINRWEFRNLILRSSSQLSSVINRRKFRKLIHRSSQLSSVVNRCEFRKLIHRSSQLSSAVNRWKFRKFNRLKFRKQPAIISCQCYCSYVVFKC